MYSETKVHQRLDLAVREFGFEPTYRTVAEVAAYDAGLIRDGKYIYDDTGRPRGVQNLSDFDRRWMLNEQIICQCDAAYFLTRYAYLRSEEGVIGRFQFRVPQRIYFDILCDLEERDAAIEIMILKARQLGMCLKPKTLILTSDLRWLPIEDIQVGQELVSVDEEGVGGKGGARRMRVGVVEGKREVFAPAYRLKFDDGREITATGEHRFLSRVRGSVSTVWRTVSEMRVGDVIRHITHPWGEPTYEDGWFAGFIDGEGSLRQKERAGSELCVAQVPGDVLERGRRYLQDHGYSFREDVDRRKGNDTSKWGDKPVIKLVLGRMGDIFRIVGQTRPARLIKKQWWQGKELPGKRIGKSWATVVSIETLPAQRMIDLQTSTRTFIAEGFVSHNSIFSELLICHRISFGYGVGAVIGSADQTKTSEMSRMMLLAYDMLPCWLRPETTSRVESDRGKLLFGQMASGVSFQHGSQKYGIATGSTPTVYHLSEVALYGDAAVKLIDEGLWKAVHASTNVLGILESTGRSNKGWWADTWYYSRDNWPASRMYPMFLPWFCGTDIYPTATDRRTHPIPAGWEPNRDTRAHAAKAALYVASTPLLKKHMIEEQIRHGVREPADTRPWAMPLDQQWFWEWNHSEAKAKGNESSFLQEMAGDDDEALQRSEESVFGHNTMVEIESRRVRTYETFALSGQSIEDAHDPEPSYIDYKRERIPIRYASRTGETYRWEMIPVKLGALREDDPDDVAGVFLIFHHPQPGVSYSIGVDTSEGKGADSTCISVWTYGSKGQPDTQVAEFSSPYVNHVEAYAFVLAIAAYYGTYMNQGVTRWREPYVSVEQVASVGDICNDQMRRMGYSNFHRMVRYDKKKISKKDARSLGWFTYGWSRPILIGNFVHSAQNGWAEVNSPWLIEEMKHFEVHHTASGKEKLEHEEGGHDDRIFASAMAVFCPHDRDFLANRSKKRAVETLTLPPIDTTPYAGHTLPYNDLRTKHVTTLEDLIYSDPRR